MLFNVAKLFKGLPAETQKSLIKGYVNSLTPDEKKIYASEYIDMLINEFLDFVEHEKRLEIGRVVLERNMSDKVKQQYTDHFIALVITHCSGQIPTLPNAIKEELKKLLK